MRCLECKTNEFEYDEVMGETACKECGLIVQTELFEERVIAIEDGEFTHSYDSAATLGSNIAGSSKLATTHHRFSGNDSHIRKGIVFANMVMTNFIEGNFLKERVAEVYRELYSKRVFTPANTLEVRGTAVTWYVLKENKTPISIKEATVEFNCKGKSLNRLIRKINSHYGNRNKQLQPDPQYLLKKTAYQISDDVVFVTRCRETLELFEPIVISIEHNKSSAYYASVCWIAKNIYLHPRITLKSIVEKTKITRSAIQKQTKDLLALIGYETCAQVKGKQIETLGRRE